MRTLAVAIAAAASGKVPAQETDDNMADSPQIKTFRKWLTAHGYQPYSDVSPSLIPQGGPRSVIDDFLADHPYFEKYRKELEDWESEQGFFTDILSGGP